MVFFGKMAAYLAKGLTQHTTEDSNSSRIITKVRLLKPMKTDAGDDNLQEAVNIVRDLHMEMDPSLDSDSIINVAIRRIQT